MAKFKLHYHVRNNGDGSASVVFHAAKKEAEQAEQKDLEEGRDGWGESCVGSVTLDEKDGKILLSGKELK